MKGNELEEMSMTFLRNAFIKFYPRMFSLSDISALGQFYIIRQNLGIHFFWMRKNCILAEIYL